MATFASTKSTLDSTAAFTLTLKLELEPEEASFTCCVNQLPSATIARVDEYCTQLIEHHLAADFEIEHCWRIAAASSAIVSFTIAFE